MKIVQINSVCGKGSTGRIAVGISQALSKDGNDNNILFTAEDCTYPLAIKYGNKKYIKFQALLSRITGNYGFLSNLQTRKLISDIEKLNPDIVHIHNIHGHDCNMASLFDYLKKKRIKVVFTLHDCWMFTGYCAYFTGIKCDKWLSGCTDCPKCKNYSFFFDKSSKLLQKKKAAFNGLSATIVTPSVWLSVLVKQSFLGQFPVKVLNNGIDLNIFKPINSNLRSILDCQNKFVLLGVSTEWGNRKGLDVFKRLANDLGNDYQIVIVGTDKKIDKQLPKNIISVHRTDSPKQLAEYYSMADIFVNPTREENFPTVNIEAIACGTPVVTYKTGGSPEIIDKKTGIAVAYDDYEGLKAEIIKLKNRMIFKQEDCVNRARQYDMKSKFNEYVSLYKEVLADGGNI